MISVRRALQQRQIGTPMGMLKIILGNLSPYANWMSLVLVGVMSFYTTISPIFTNWGLPLPFWAFCSILAVALVLMGLLEWTFMMPSFYKANNQQVWDAGGPMQDKIAEMEAEQRSMSKDIAEIKELLKKRG